MARAQEQGEDSVPGEAAGVWASLWGPGVVAVSGLLTEIAGAGWPVIWWELQCLFI